MFEALFNDPLVKSVIDLSDRLDDRMAFHQQSHPIMREMAKPEFIARVFETNLKDEGFLNRQWTNYEIPFLYLYENNHFYLKYHIFLPVASKETHKAANIIHHHNNYHLSSMTVFGPGYHTLQFEKEIKHFQDGSAQLKITEDFFHKTYEVNVVESWEPHIVFNMDDMTTTLVLWSPDEKHMTDGLRNHPLIKPFKKILLKGIHAFGLDKRFGVAPKDVMQYYVEDGKVVAIRESDYFDYYKNQKGQDVVENYIQSICHFMQRIGYKNSDFLTQTIEASSTPVAWKKWLTKLRDGGEIPMVFGKEEINIPKKAMYLDEVRKACS